MRVIPTGKKRREQHEAKDGDPLVDARDVHAYVGLGLMTAGAWYAIGAAALVVLGVGLFYLGLRRA